MRNGQIPNVAAATKVAPRTVFAAFACIVAVVLALFALPTTSYAAGTYTPKTLSDGTGTLTILQPITDGEHLQSLAVSDTLVSDSDLTYTTFIASAKAYNEQFGYEPDDPQYFPEDMTNIFVVENTAGLSGKTVFCMLIMTEKGTYFMGRPDAYDPEEVPGIAAEYYPLEESAYEDSLVFYSPTTLSGFINESEFVADSALDILHTMTKVTAENASTIPFPDPETYSPESPETFLLIPMLYDAPALPEDFDPTQLKDADSDSSEAGDGTLYYLPSYSAFTATSPTECIDYPMVAGSFKFDDNLVSPGSVGTYLWIPALDDGVNVGWYWGDEHSTGNVLNWKVPEGAELDFVSWMDNKTTIATGASLINEGDQSITTPITDIHYASNRKYVNFTYNAPEYKYMTAVTDLVPYPGEYGFIDVPTDAWYNKVVALANENEYMTGWDTWYFGPEQTLSRAMAATVTYRMAGQPGLGDEAPEVFADVPTDEWYSYPIYWANEEGIVTGYGNRKGYFGPDDTCTREQFAAMLFRWAKVYQDATAPADPAAVLAGYRDAGQVADWAREAVAWAVENGIMGVDSSELNPQGNILRCEAAAMAVRTQPNGVAVG